MNMNTKTLYTAVGRFERQRDSSGRSFPVIRLAGKEYMADLQEMLIWSSLNWRIARKEEIGEIYNRHCQEGHYTAKHSWEDCVKRLLLRGLIVCGSGESEYDALYDLLSAMYIVPAEGTLPLRVLSFFKLTLIRRIPFSITKKLFLRDRRTEHEQQVMNLARHNLLSTAEIIRCAEKEIHSLANEQAVVDQLYSDPYTTSDNINYLVRSSPKSQAVILAVANLYLRKQIIFERL